MKYVKIPKDRIGVLIGQNGEVKERLETMTQTILVIDSETGEVLIDDHNCSDPLLGLKTDLIVRAIARGFSPEHAFSLLSDSNEFYLFDIHDYVGKKENHIRRLKARIIGTEGKTKRYLERLTGAHLSIYGHTIGVIVHIDYLEITRHALDMLLTGSKHSTVYAYVERQMKKLRTSTW